MKKFIFFLFLLMVGGLFYFRWQAYYSHGYADERIFHIEKGDGNAKVASHLEQEGLVSGNWYFYYYIRSHGMINKIIPGDYFLSGQMTIPEIAEIITNQEEKFVKITFPEGWTADLMAERLNINNLPGDAFKKIFDNPGAFRKRYSYLADAQTLEGYLFPDTYYFKPDVSAENIVGRMLDTFDQKFNPDLRQAAAAQSKRIKDVVTMASIIEKEVQTPEDMKIVSGIFWKRLRDGQRLQSDAPLSYVLNDKIDQHSGAQLDLNSPYNTYRNTGMPPGPIGNPGLDAIVAAIYPQNSNYYYFLTATVNGEKKVIYSATYDEHLANKLKYGL